MHGMTTLAQVTEQVQELSAHCHDELIPTREISFTSLATVELAGDIHPIRLIAQRALAARLTIPFEYLNRCPAEVQAYNLNHWIRQERHAELFFRFDGEAVRAVFTPRYRPVDNGELLQQLEQLGYDSQTQVQCHLDANFLSLSIPDGTRTFRINGDGITPGVSIANSEVGLSSLKIAAFFLRLRCTNGLIARTEIQTAYRHVSRKGLDAFPQVLAGISTQLGRQQDKFRISMASRVADPLSTIASLSKQFQLSEMEKAAIEWGYAYEPGYTMFHIVNAYTRAAMFPGLSAAASYKLQTVGGQILAMVK